MAAVAGSPPRHPSADYSSAIVHIMPAGKSQREWVEAMQAPECGDAEAAADRKRSGSQSLNLD